MLPKAIRRQQKQETSTKTIKHENNDELLDIERETESLLQVRIVALGL